MKLLNEIITELVKEEEPFELCDECKELGYCRLEYVIAMQEERKPVFMKEDEICNLIPISMQGEYYGQAGKYCQKHLQAAFEAFHQQDYETAILKCQAVIEENKGLPVPYLLIAVCQYFLGDYAEAINQCELYLNTWEYISGEEEYKGRYFIWQCGQMQIEKLKHESAITLNSLSENENFKKTLSF